MATHDPVDIAFAGLVLNLGLMRVLTQKGVLQDSDGAAILNSAIDALGKDNPRRESIANIFHDLLPNKKPA